MSVLMKLVQFLCFQVRKSSQLNLLYLLSPLSGSSATNVLKSIAAYNFLNPYPRVFIVRIMLLSELRRMGSAF